MIDNEIEQQLRDALAHLYDPNFRPEPKLCEFLGCQVQDGMVAVESTILKAIEDLKPKDPSSTASQITKFYEVLYNRYVLLLTLEETALRMHLSVSSTWRDQRSAINYLATVLWKKSHVLYKPGQSGDPNFPDRIEQSNEDPQNMDWHEQARRELASLYRYTPDAVADVGKLVESVLELENNLAVSRGVQLEWVPNKSRLVAEIHPTVLRQLLIAVIGFFVRNTENKKVMLFTKLEDGNIKITVTARFSNALGLTESDLLKNIPLLDDSSAEVFQDGNQVYLWLKFPSVERVTVLVVDDNQDMIRLYRRASEGSNYRIVPYVDGQDLFDAIQTTAPDVIVLDVMLPRQDGWDLLMQLHANQVTRYIPVIICSVVKEAELAYALGAAKFISKPVLPQDFIQALDQILAQIP
jgi:CheY-like chemotaxis protein